jgi:fucose permease
VHKATRGFRHAFALILALFFLWGMANNLNDILIAQFRKAFTLSTSVPAWSRARSIWAIFS